MNVRAILFDLGQTLLEYPASTTEEWGEFLHSRLTAMHPLFARHIDAADDDRTFATRAREVMWPDHSINTRGKSWHFRERLQAIFSIYGAECPDRELEALTDAFYQPIAAGTRRYPETRDALRRLRGGGLPLAIISNAPWDVPGRLLLGDMKRWGIDGYFEARVMSGDVPWRKPNPEFMLAAARELGVAPGECLVVGDSLRADIAGAKAAGIRSVWINREGAVLSPNSAQPDWQAASLTEVVKIVEAA